MAEHSPGAPGPRVASARPSRPCPISRERRIRDTGSRAPHSQKGLSHDPLRRKQREEQRRNRRRSLEHVGKRDVEPSHHPVESSKVPPPTTKAEKEDGPERDVIHACRIRG